MNLRGPRDRQEAASSAEPVLEVDEARARILSALAPIDDTVRVSLLDSLGRILAEDLVAQENLPPFANSAMDGYAVRSADTVTASVTRPVELPVVEEIAAGDEGLVTLPIGSAIRIMTGAPLPVGADAVTRFEEVDVRPSGSGSHASSSILISRSPSTGQNVRQAGEDVQRGSMALSRGSVIGAPEIGLLAALGINEVLCRRPPRVAILATGDEIIDAGHALHTGQIRNSNSPMLAALTTRFGGEPRLAGIARDIEHDIIDRLAAVRDADLIVTSGGVSVGDYDVVKQVLRREGEIDLWRVRMKPGKPLAFGRIGTTPLLGLPGNPAAAYVAYIQFGRPAIRRMLGLSAEPDLVPARLIGEIENRGARRQFVQAILSREGQELVVRPIPSRGSASLSALVASNCLVVIPAGEAHVLHGAIVDVQPTGESFQL